MDFLKCKNQIFYLLILFLAAAKVQGQSDADEQVLWSHIQLTGTHAKVFGLPAVPPDRISPWIPIGAGVVGAGVVAGLIVVLNDDDSDAPPIVNPCNFSPDIIATIDSADCGLENGQITIDVNPLGDYTYEWSSGATQANLGNVAASSYVLSITEPITNCSIDTSLVVPQNPTNYIENLVTESGMCGNGAFVSFDLSGPDGEQMVVAVTHPNGFDNFLFPNGYVELSSVFDMISGDYTMEVYPESAGEDCAENYSWSLQNNELYLVELVDVVAPSTAGGSDGSAVFEIANFSGVSYDVMVDMIFYGSFASSGFEVEGLNEGVHIVDVIDSFGCIVTITVQVPPSDGFQFGILKFPETARQREKSKAYSRPTEQIYLTYQYTAFGVPLESGVGTQWDRQGNRGVVLQQNIVKTLIRYKMVHVDAGLGARWNANAANQLSLNIKLNAAVKLLPKTELGIRIQNLDAGQPFQFETGLVLRYRWPGFSK